MDPSVCGLHPGVAVTGFCPACLRDRLAGLHPPSSADLRRCKSLSYARSSAAAAQSHLVEPQRRSCDLFSQEQYNAVPEAEEDTTVRRMEEHIHPQEPSRKSLGGLLGKKLQQWRRKSKLKKEPMPPPESEMPGRHRQHSFQDAQPRRSYDVDPRFSPRASWDARSGPVPVFAHLPATMLSVEEDMPVPRSDGQIPVEEDYYYYYYGNADAVPGGCAQTRDYYLDSSSSSRRRRSLDRSTASGRNSFSDANNELPRMMNANARVSPAIAAEFCHAQSVLVHRQYCRDQGPSNLRDRDGLSGSFGSAFLDHTNKGVPANKPKKGIRGWNIWGLIHKKSSSRKPEADYHGPFSAAAGAAGGGEYPCPQLRARGYNGQMMLRCHSSVSARNSLSGGAAMIGGSGRRSTSGVDVNGHGFGRMRRDEVLLERNLSTRPCYSRSAGPPPPPPHLDHPMQFSRPNQNGVVSGNKGRSSRASSLPRRSTLGL
ncbi:protein OCTOPUS-like [Phragmites australis]|uniref:protein OCTOPUS-like n=1 Tax=Phragmites australis TaxID=29695 RepID=UPI002D7A3113|nr:protein OCTOPUS-like [Phragmites australis]